MDANQLKNLSKFYDANKEYIANEEAAKMGLVVPFIRLLGYDPNLPKEVRPEYSASFVQGDGKRLPDRMDYAIFDSTGTKPLMVFETKALGTDIASRSNQLARYIAQLPGLHFGVITDGCHYNFFGDLENPNKMDDYPFFTFALDDSKTDWDKVAKFLSKFSRESFNAETLITEAENSRYRQEMIDKLVKALKSPKDDDAFMQWLTADLYKGKRTVAVMARLGEVARDSIEPTLLRVMSNDFIERLREGLQRTLDSEKEKSVGHTPPDAGAAKISEKAIPGAPPDTPPVATSEKLEFHRLVRDMCVEAGAPPNAILGKDTTYYFNVSYGRPTFWFVRLFADSKRKNITTLVPVSEATGLAKGFEVEEAPAAFGASRIFVKDLAQIRDLRFLIVRSLGILQAQKTGPEVLAAEE